MQKNRALPEWLTKLINKYQLKQSWLTINANDPAQLLDMLIAEKSNNYLLNSFILNECFKLIWLLRERR